MHFLKAFLCAATLFLAVISVTAQEKSRTERDLLGEKQVPADAYYGVQTVRALENFQISGVDINHYPGFVEAWAIVKLAAARANTDVGAMKPEKLAAIEKACNAVLAGKYHDQFVVDWYQGGAGTSTNMNANDIVIQPAAFGPLQRAVHDQFRDRRDVAQLQQIRRHDEIPVILADLLLQMREPALRAL